MNDMIKAFCPKCGLHFEISEGTQSIKCPCCTVVLFFDEEADPCDGCKHKSGRYFGRCIHCSRNPKATEDYFEPEAKYETCAHGFVMQINDGDGYPLSKDRGCDVGKIAVDECDCPVDCPDYQPRKETKTGSVQHLGEAKEIEKMLDEEIEKLHDDDEHTVNTKEFPKKHPCPECGSEMLPIWKGDTCYGGGEKTGAFECPKCSHEKSVKCRWCGLELPPAYCVHEWVMCPNPKCGMDILPLSPEVEDRPEEDESP